MVCSAGVSNYRSRNVLQCNVIRAVNTEVVRGAASPQVQLLLYSNQRRDFNYAHYIATCPQGFLDPPTALLLLSD